MVFAIIEWTDPSTNDICRVLSLTDGSHTFEVVDAEGFVVRCEPHLSHAYALTCAAEWRHEHGLAGPALAA